MGGGLSALRCPSSLSRPATHTHYQVHLQDGCDEEEEGTPRPRGADQEEEGGRCGEEMQSCLPSWGREGENCALLLRLSPPFFRRRVSSPGQDGGVY